MYFNMRNNVLVTVLVLCLTLVTPILAAPAGHIGESGAVLSRRSELDNIKRQIESLAVRAIHEPRVVDLQRRRGNIFKSILNGIRRAFGGKPKGPKAPKPPPLDTSFGSVPSIPSAFTPVRSNFRKRLDQIDAAKLADLSEEDVRALAQMEDLSEAEMKQLADILAQDGDIDLESLAELFNEDGEGGVEAPKNP